MFAGGFLKIFVAIFSCLFFVFPMEFPNLGKGFF